MLTAYDGVTFGDCVHHRHLDPNFYTPPNVAAIVKEYSDLTLYLYETYRGTHKRCILSNWESDNEVYCGAAYAYATDPTARAACNVRYPSAYDGNRSPDDSIRGLIFWFQARQQGIEDGRSRALNHGIGGKRVYLAPEFSVVRALHNAGFKSVLYDVLPFVTFDYASYSSYESINQAEPERALLADLNTIQDVIGSSAIILGEFGFARSAWGAEGVVSKTDRLINTAVLWGISYVFQWNMYDQSARDDFGMYDVRGQLTVLGEYYRKRIGADPSVMAGLATRPRNVRERGLFGDFRDARHAGEIAALEERGRGSQIEIETHGQRLAAREHDGVAAFARTGDPFEHLRGAGGGGLVGLLEEMEGGPRPSPLANPRSVFPKRTLNIASCVPLPCQVNFLNAAGRPAV